MATELTNKFNAVVTNRIIEYFQNQITYDPDGDWDSTLSEFIANGGYTRFIVVYNTVSLKLWFGNRADGFAIINEIADFTNVFVDNFCKIGRKKLPDFATYGLPGYLGLSRCNQPSMSSFDIEEITNVSKFNGKPVPRFYYGDVTPGDNGYWLLPLDSSGCNVHWVEALYKLNIMGEAFMYMEIDGANCIDETKPYNISKFTIENNKTNGVVNSSFAKIPIPTTPLSQWFDRDSVPYKLYYPPAERIRKIRIRLRYHNGQLVNFGVFNYSFMLEFNILVPQILRNSNVQVVPPPMGR
jgi:hypothetical protein